MLTLEKLSNKGLEKLAKLIWDNIIKTSVDEDTIPILYSFNEIIFELSNRTKKDSKEYLKEITGE